MSTNYAILREMVRLGNDDDIVSMINDIGDELGNEKGRMPEIGRTYMILRASFTQIDDDQEVYNGYITIVPWTIKNGNEERADIDPKILNRVCAVAYSLINNQRPSVSILDLLGVKVEEPYGAYLQYNWHKYAKQAHCYSTTSYIEHGENLISFAKCSMYRLDL